MSSRFSLLKMLNKRKSCENLTNGQQSPKICKQNFKGNSILRRLHCNLPRRYALPHHIRTGNSRGR